MVFESISEKPFSQQELLNRKLHLAHAKLTTAVDLSNIFALFSIYSTVDLNISPGEASSSLLIVFIIVVSLLVVVTVLVKIAIMYITPRLETALFMSRYDIKEFDIILHGDVVPYMEIVWIITTLGCTFLFGLNLILIAWIRMAMFTRASAVGTTVIMIPVLIFSVLFATVSYFRIRKRHRNVLLNEEEIITGSSKVHYAKNTTSGNAMNSHVANSKWDILRTHVVNENKLKTHIV